MHITASVTKLILSHKESLLKHTNLEWERISNVTYLYEFDREVQYVILYLPSSDKHVLLLTNLDNRTATWGYPTEGAYYRDASCSDGIMAIRIPFFALSAADDPVGS